MTPARIPLCEPLLDGNEAAYLQQCVDSGYVSSTGPFVTAFETALAEAVGAGNAVAATSGTAALHLALLVAGVGPGDLVLVSDLTFIAPANAVRYVGAEPLFVDADPATWQMDPMRVAAFLEADCETRDGVLVDRAGGRRVAACLPVHILGGAVDMDPLLDVLRPHGVAVIEDATESLGARYKGRPLGTLGDIGCFSFNGNKLVTAGGGGMLVTERGDLAARARHLSTQAKADPVEAVHDTIGYNYRLTNLQAAVGLAQVERLDSLAAAKRRLAGRYREVCAELPGLAFMPAPDWAEGVFWLSTVTVDPVAFGMNSRALMAFLDARGIESRPLWQPMHRSPAQAGAGALGGAVAETLHATALSLPSSCGLDEGAFRTVAGALREAAGRT